MSRRYYREPIDREDRLLKRRQRTQAIAAPASSWLSRVALVVIQAKLVLLPVIMDPLGDDVFALPKTALSRALGYVLLAVLAAYVARYRREIPRSVVWVPLAAFLGIATLSTVLAAHPATALYGAAGRLLGATAILDGALLAFAVAVFVRTSTDARRFAFALLAPAVLVLAYGSVQLLGRDVIQWAGERVVTSTIGNTGAFAGYLVIVAAAGAYVALRMVDLPRWQRGVAGGIALASALEVVAAGARGPALALPFGVAAAAALAARNRRPIFDGRVSRRRALVVVVIAALALLAVPFTPAGARLTRLVTGGSADSSLAERVLIYEAALNAFRQRPVLGAGPDSFVAVYLLARSPEAARLPGTSPTQSSTHSWVLHHAVGTGALGLLAIAALCLTAGAIAWRRSRDPSAIPGLGGALLVAFVFQGLFNITHVATEWLFWLSLGLVAASAPQQAVPSTGGRRAANSRSRSANSGVDGRPAVIAVILGVVAAASVLSSLQASRAAAASRVLERAGKFDAARAAAQVAVAFDRNRAEYWNLLGIALEPVSAEEAVSAFRSAADRSPHDSVYWLNAARQELRIYERSRTDRARRAALELVEQAASVDPYSADAHLWRARILLSTGAPRDALGAADRAVELAPPGQSQVLQAHAIAAEAHLARGEPALAVERLRTAIDLAAATRHSLELTLRTDLARILLDMGRRDEARAEAELVKARQPENAAAGAILKELAEAR